MYLCITILKIQNCFDVLTVKTLLSISWISDSCEFCNFTLACLWFVRLSWCRRLSTTNNSAYQYQLQILTNVGRPYILCSSHISNNVSISQSTWALATAPTADVLEGVDVQTGGSERSVSWCDFGVECGNSHWLSLVHSVWYADVMLTQIDQKCSVNHGFLTLWRRLCWVVSHWPYCDHIRNEAVRIDVIFWPLIKAAPSIRRTLSTTSLSTDLRHDGFCNAPHVGCFL